MTREALKSAKVLNMLHVVEDGADALAFLHRQGKFADAVRLHLILLDLNLPRKSGLEVLADVKADLDLMRIPIVMLTSSRDEQDILRAYGLHVNSFVTKRVDFAEFASVIRSIERFWLTVVIFPDDANRITDPDADVDYGKISSRRALQSID